MTRIVNVRGALKEEVLSGKFNIYIGISMGNAWFTKQNIKEYLLWALKHTKERVCMLIADSIHSINVEVRDNRSPASALKRALNKGAAMKRIVTDIILELPKEQQQKIDVIRWADVLQDKQYADTRRVIYEEYDLNSEFRKSILGVCRSHLANETRVFNEEKIALLSKYILEELPTSLNGFVYKKTKYSAWIYPEDGLLGELVEDIQKMKRFASLHEKTAIGKNAFIILETSH